MGCSTFEGFGKVAATFYVSAHSAAFAASSSTDVALKANIGGLELSVRKNTEKAWTACYDGKCTNFCVWDKDCPSLNGYKRICAQFSGRFQCEYKYQACCKGVISGGCKNEDWKDDCSIYWGNRVINLLSRNSPSCSDHPLNDGKSSALGYGPWKCYRLTDDQPTVTKSGLCRIQGKTAKFKLKSDSVPSSGSGSSSAGSGSGSSSGTPSSGSSSAGSGSGSSSGTPPSGTSSSGSSSAGSGSGSASDDECPGGEDTGGRCSFTSCSTSRGGVTCLEGKCVCSPGYCLTGGERCDKPVGLTEEVSKSYRLVVTPVFFVLALSSSKVQVP